MYYPIGLLLYYTPTHKRKNSIMAKKITSKKKSPKTTKKKNPPKDTTAKQTVNEPVVKRKNCWLTMTLRFLGVK